ncbi:bifunctional diaminohydroxyphosphoribosylaminopyrimidine deaminase/5-amino-6-(5-phosphoribosylamino)uracil reductase RibD [Leptospira ilyithenensis]|uniref:bifunctional diaminohydroxyphosphoribosylaminopyrimidine deaminase/5-amino-6-(5-phosphoribosylamino)uracil reductase RibD n=1 Tax=Leptospira ilyithenensis TaxID=2484901 RepID=UPI0014384335|nr:dihydrofolate reductase family protein [Leptospira ilyithenensis]
MRRLSFSAMGLSSPNPPVAALILDDSGRILASGHTQISGGFHAERAAYTNWKETLSRESLEQKNISHSLVVSLEPCTHFGKTPPCRDLILSEKPKELVIGFKDPNPLVASGDWGRYKEQGIVTRLAPEVAKYSFPYLFGFFTRMKKEKPWIWIKSAVTKQGFYASEAEERVQITSESSDYYLQMLRGKFDAIVVGPKTVSTDEPSLNFRLTEESFRKRGDVTKLFVSDNEKFFFSPGKEFLENLLTETNEKERYDFHIGQIQSFQPYRIFMLGESQVLSKTFVEKQSDLNLQMGKRGCIFYRILAKNSKKSDMKSKEDSKLLELSDFPIDSFYSDEGGLFLQSLAKREIGTTILEVGSFLYEFVKDHLEEEDCILTVEGNSNVTISDGKKFAGFSEGELVSGFQVGEDRWNLHCLSKRV